MSCYLCGGDNFTVMAEAREMRFRCFGKRKQVLKCSSCGLVQLVPQWSQQEIDDLYKTYWDKQDFEGQKPKVKVSRYLRWLIHTRDLAVEVGCGRGDNVEYLRRKGRSVIGIDKSPTATGTKMDYKDCHLGGATVVYAIHLFEHLPDPRHFLGWVYTNLRKKGLLILEIPSLDDPLIKLYNNKKYQQFYWYPYHLFYYDQDTIRKMFGGKKIKVRLRQEYGIVNHLRRWIKGKPGNWNPHIPILDDLYKLFITKALKLGDTMVILCSI